MKTLIKLLSIALLGLFSCKKEIYPSGSITREEQYFNNFTAVEVHDGFELILTYTDNESVIIEANQNLQHYIHAWQSGNRIIFERDNDVYFDRCAHVRIYVSASKLKNIDASGGSNISATNTLQADHLSLQFSGGSRLTAELDCNGVSADLSGGSRINITGTANTFRVDVSGGSQFLDYGFAVRYLDCHASGGSKGNCTVEESLDVEASGGSNINYQGEGRVLSSDLSGGSRLRHQ